MSPNPAEPAHEFKQPGWDHVMGAFIEGAREARANPTATDDDFKRAADGHTKRVHEEVDPDTERRLRENDWRNEMEQRHLATGDSQIEAAYKRLDLSALPESLRPSVAFEAGWRASLPAVAVPSAPLAEAAKALQELVALKDLKDKADAGQFRASDGRDMTDYYRRKPLAWAAARAVCAALATLPGD